MKHQAKLSQQQQHIETNQSQSQAGQDFANSDELLRFDATQITMPPKIAERLKQSVGILPPPTASARPWWKNLLGQ
jgi:hypothetical protein